MFNTLLIANRGEIACRIIKSAQKMGLTTVALYSSADANSLHTRLADRAIYIGESPSNDSYLNIEKIIQAAKETHAEAIHPGYGFLSENVQFAKACLEAKIIFVGPGIEALETMGSKQRAKQLLQDSNVPLTPGYHGTLQSDEVLLKEAKRIGFPVLLKAANGGGGKGMRSVHDESAFLSSLASAKREACASFADDTMIIEKLIINPRHVEVQIMADNHGQVVHLFERDCSIQRRHQKIIEEAPAPNLSASLRDKLHHAACEVARKINYRGAGTIEFLVSPDESFYFMEMNTRLQVEHPVTEMYTGLDLVEWQLGIAAGEPLPCTQSQIIGFGHAIECRIYAEDPANQFLPSIGRIRFLEEPKSEGIRIDTGVTEGSDITQYYDPMIAKLIAHGKTREQAISRLIHALNHYAIGGVKTNISFLKSVLNHSTFKKAQLTTHFLNEAQLHCDIVSNTTALLFAASADYLALTHQITDPLMKDNLGFQPYITRHWTECYEFNDTLFSVNISPISACRVRITINHNAYEIKISQHINTLTIDDGHQQQKTLLEHIDNSIYLYFNEGLVKINRKKVMINSNETNQNSALTAPMPSTVVAILKKVGDAVLSGECVLVLEAMKMEHTIQAPNDGIITHIFYDVGAQVTEGVVLFAIE